LLNALVSLCAARAQPMTTAAMWVVSPSGGPARWPTSPPGPSTPTLGGSPRGAQARCHAVQQVGTLGSPCHLLHDKGFKSTRVCVCVCVCALSAGHVMPSRTVSDHLGVLHVAVMHYMRASGTYLEHLRTLASGIVQHRTIVVLSSASVCRREQRMTSQEKARDSAGDRPPDPVMLTFPPDRVW
jgi:hypothetical protein